MMESIHPSQGYVRARQILDKIFQIEVAALVRNAYFIGNEWILSNDYVGVISSVIFDCIFLIRERARIGSFATYFLFEI